MKQLIILFVMPLLFSNTIFADSNQGDKKTLKKLNVEIAAAEDRGDRQWLESVLASEFSFRRASGVVVGRKQFLKDVKPRPKSKTKIENITVYGKDRAIVTCIVTIMINGQEAAFHNVRLFIRGEAGWKILGWANEPMTKK